MRAGGVRAGTRRRIDAGGRRGADDAPPGAVGLAEALTVVGMGDAARLARRVLDETPEDGRASRRIGLDRANGAVVLGDAGVADRLAGLGRPIGTAPAGGDWTETPFVAFRDCVIAMVTSWDGIALRGAGGERAARAVDLDALLRMARDAWIDAGKVTARSTPRDAAAVEREEALRERIRDVVAAEGDAAPRWIGVEIGDGSGGTIASKVDEGGPSELARATIHHAMSLHGPGGRWEGPRSCHPALASGWTRRPLTFSVWGPSHGGAATLSAVATRGARRRTLAWLAATAAPPGLMGEATRHWVVD